MATFYLNHDAEIYHSYMAAYEEEFYGDDPNELYHYGRKGMRRGMHLPDILDPTRELVGKVASTGKSYMVSARRTANQYAKRLSKYGTMARSKFHENIENPLMQRVGKYRGKYEKYKAAKELARNKEKYELDELRKYKAENEAKKKNVSYEDNENQRKQSAADNINNLRAQWSKAIDEGDKEKARELSNRINAAKKAEKNRQEREQARQSETYVSKHSSRREEAMSEFAKQQEKQKAKAKAHAERDKMKDPMYAQQKANEKASAKAGEAGLARADKRKQENDYNRRISEQLERDGKVREEQLRREYEERKYKRRGSKIGGAGKPKTVYKGYH